MQVDTKQKEAVLWPKNASFPAFERAKQRFLQRQQIEAISRSSSSVSSSFYDDFEPKKDQKIPVSPIVNKDKCFSKTTQMILELCETFDQDLLFIDKQVTRTNRICTKQYHQLVQDLDTCTTAFLEGHTNISKNPIKQARVSVSIKPKQQHVRQRKHMPCDNQVSKQKFPIVSNNQGVPKLINHSKLQYNQMDPVALKNHAAMTLQCRFRRFLYKKLYLGGLNQWRQANELALQSTKRFFWVQWRRFRYQKQRKRTLYRRRIRSWIDSKQRYLWSREKGQEVVAMDGKYAMAKVYHTKRQLVSYWCLWLQYLSQRPHKEIEEEDDSN